MGARRYRIFLRVFNLISYLTRSLRSSRNIKLNTRREIPYLQAAMCYSHTSNGFLTISKGFRTLTAEVSPKVVRRPGQSLPIICRRFPKITEDFRGRTDDVSMIQEHSKVLFKGLYNHSNGDNMLFPRLK